MERKNSLSIITNTGKITPEIITSPGSSTKRKRRGPVQLFKVAMFMIRRRSFKSKPADVAAPPGVQSTATDNVLNRLVGSVRPLMHLQSNDDEDEYSSSLAAAAAARVVVAEEPLSPATTWSENDDEMNSRYGSAVNLQELEHRHQSESRYASAVNLRDMDTNSEVNGVDYGDEMIDAKAEEFIAQFYAQIRLQRYNEMVERSIA